MSAPATEQRFLSPSREQELADFAEWIADDHFRGETPIDPEGLARKRGITVSRGNYGDSFDGLLEHKTGRFHIYCNMARSRLPARGRFTIAHELGHFFIDEHREALSSGRVNGHGSFCDFRSKNPVEREADCFASNLLMPPKRFRRAVGSRRVSLSTVMHISETFQASRTAAAVRLVNLDLTICGAVLWQEGRFIWKWLSDKARAAGLRTSLNPADTVPPDSATGRVIAGEDEADEHPIASVSTAATWFRGISHGSSRNIVLQEEAISLGRFGVLTMLVERSM